MEAENKKTISNKLMNTAVNSRTGNPAEGHTNQKNDRIKSIALIAITALIIAGFSLGSLIKPQTDYSLSERRSLAKQPAVTAQGLSSGSYMSDFEAYSLDQFPMRDTFRSVKSIVSLYVSHRMDTNGLYTADGYLSSLEYPTNPVLIQSSVKKLDQVYGSFIQNTNCHVYLSVIPDKNYFLAPANGYPIMDYQGCIDTVREGLPYAQYIDIFPLLSLEDYYKTDQHWRQENVIDVAEALMVGMGNSGSTNYVINELATPFYGTYYGQIAIPFAPDTIRYLTNDVIDGCTVTSYASGQTKEISVYDMKKADGKDPYEMFLGGADPLIEIVNPNAKTGKELVIFRDSFTSSLAPLMAENYSKITLVDLRYIRSDFLKNYIEFTDQDVLFLYSTLILNSSAFM